jgi:hypothetical protein
VSGDRGVTDESRLGAWREEPHAQVMIGTIGLEHERRVGVVELARDGEHFRVREPICFEHDACGIAGEAIRREGVDLKNADAAVHEGGEFYPQTRVTQGRFPLPCAAPRGGRFSGLRRGWSVNP